MRVASAGLFLLGCLPLPAIGGCETIEGGYVCTDEACQAGLLCGNGIRDEGEACDETREYCSVDCSESFGRCDDGIIQVEFGEVCDEGSAQGGASGLGGALISEEIEGCSRCNASVGYLCDPRENICFQTRVEPTEQVVDHPEEVCRWLVGLMGGEGSSFFCTSGGESRIVEIGTVEHCVEVSRFAEDCAISEIEEWALDKERCDIFYGRSPCHL